MFGFMSALIFFLYKTIGRYRFFNNLVRRLYLSFFLPLLERYLCRRYKNILFIEKRHSILDEERFNAFLSDIDLTIVIKNSSDGIIILKSFFKIRKVFLMLDVPEVYTQDEFAQLELIRRGPHWGAVYAIWSIRKINWNYASMVRDASKLNLLKKERSIKQSLSKIMLAESLGKLEFELSDFKAFCYLSKKGKSIPGEAHRACSYSPYLETNREHALRILIDSSELESFNSLLPAEGRGQGSHALKMDILLYEILLTKASMRIDEAHGVVNPAKKQWHKHLTNLYSR